MLNLSFNFSGVIAHATTYMPHQYMRRIEKENYHKNPDYIQITPVETGGLGLANNLFRQSKASGVCVSHL